MVKLGSVEFELVADNSELLSAFVQAKASAEQASAAISRAVKAQELAIVNAGNGMGDAMQKVADESAKEGAVFAATAKKAADAFKAMADAAKAGQAPIQQLGQGAVRAAEQIKSIQSAGGQVESAGQSFLKLAGSMAVGQLAAEAFSKAMDVVIETTKASVKAAGDLEAANLRVAQAFGGQGTAMKAAADGIAAYSGISKASAESMVADQNNLIKSFGLSSEQVAGLGARLTDLAQVNGGTVPDAFKAAMAAMDGNTDALKAYGVEINTTTLQAYGGLTEFQAKHLDLLDKETKAQAILATIMGQTTDAVGKAAEAGDTLNGKLQTLNQITETLKETLGKQLNPAVKEGVDLLIKFFGALNDVLPEMANLQQIGLDFAQQKGMPEWMAYLLGPGAKAIAGLIGLVTDPAFRAAEDAKFANGPGGTPGDTGVQVGPSPEDVKRAIATQNALEIKGALERAEAIRKIEEEKQKLIAELAVRAAQDEHTRVVRAIDDEKTRLQFERDARLRAFDEQQRAELAAIAASKQAAKKASDDKIEILQHEMTEKLRIAQDGHQDTLHQLEAEQRATKAATDEAIRQKEHERDQLKAAAGDRKDAAIQAIEAEQYAFKRAHEEVVALIQQRKDREQRAAEDTHTAAIRGIERQQQAEQKQHDARTAQIQKQKDQAQQAAAAAHEAATRGLDAEIETTNHARDLADQSIKGRREDEDRLVHDRRATEDAYLKGQATAEDRALDARRLSEDRLLKDQQSAQDRALDLRRASEDKALDSGRASADRALRQQREAEDKALAVNLDHQKAAHETRLGQLKAESEAIQAGFRQMEAVYDGLTEGEAARHKQAMAGIEAEFALRMGTIDAEEKALDDADKADRQRARLQQLNDAKSSAQDDLARAISTGNQSTIADAERKLAAIIDQIRQAGVDAERDAARTEIGIRRDQLKQEEADRKAAEDVLNDQQKRLIAGYRTEADASRDLALAAIKDRTEAEDAAYDLITQDARDAADAQKAALADLREAEGLALKAQRDAEDAAIAAQRDAEDLALATTRTAYAQSLVDRRTLEDQQIKDSRVAHDLEITAQRTAEDRAITDRRTAEDTGIAAQRYAEDQAYAARKLTIADAYADEQAKIAKTYDDPVSGLLAKQQQQAKDAEDKYARRKQTVDDAYKAEQRKIADTYDDPVSGLLARQHAMAEDADHQYALRKTAVGAAYDDEIAQIHATYDDQVTGLIPHMREAQAQTDEQYRLRKETVNSAYEDEQRAIHDTYMDPTTGLIPLERDAQAATQEQYNTMAADVRASAESQKAAIRAIYENGEKTGLIDLQDRAKQNADDTLRDQTQYWQDWGNHAGQSIRDVIAEYDKLIAKIKAARKAGGGGDDGDGSDAGQDQSPGSGGGPAFPVRGGGGTVGGQYRPIVDNAADDSYWTDQGTHGGHPAADIFAPMGSAIHAPTGGTVEPGTYPAGGNAATMEGDDGKWYYFAHGKVPFKGGRVEAGQQIGQVGDTGNARGGRPHLHFAMASKESLFSAWNGSGDLWGTAEDWQGRAGGGRLGPIGGGVGGAGDPNASASTIRHYVDQRAESLQIDPDIAERVVQSEGHFEPMAVGKFASGWSFWPLQAHYGGRGYEQYGYQAGQGTQFTKDTGFQPGDKSAWAPSLDWQLDYVKKHGWDEWYGASKQGITGYMGIVRGMAKGGVIHEPTLLVGQTSGPYAIAGEAGPEFVVPPGAPGAARPQVTQVPIYLGNREVERLWIEGYNLNIRRGRRFGGMGG